MEAAINRYLQDIKLREYGGCPQDATAENYELQKRTNHPHTLTFTSYVDVLPGAIDWLNLDSRDDREINFAEITKNDGEFLKKFVNLTKLNVNFCGLKSLQNLPNLQNLRRMELIGNKLQNLHGIPSLHNLTDLILFGNSLTSLEGMEEFPKLELLDVTKNLLGGNALQILPSKCKQLKILYIAHNKFKDIEDFIHLNSLKELTQLMIYENDVVEKLNNYSWVIKPPKLEYVCLENGGPYTPSRYQFVGDDFIIPPPGFSSTIPPFTFPSTSKRETGEKYKAAITNQIPPITSPPTPPLTTRLLNKFLSYEEKKEKEKKEEEEEEEKKEVMNDPQKQKNIQNANLNKQSSFLASLSFSSASTGAPEFLSYLSSSFSFSSSTSPKQNNTPQTSPCSSSPSEVSQTPIPSSPPTPLNKFGGMSLSSWRDKIPRLLAQSLSALLEKSTKEEGKKEDKKVEEEEGATAASTPTRTPNTPPPSYSSLNDMPYSPVSSFGGQSPKVPPLFFGGKVLQSQIPQGPLGSGGIPPVTYAQIAYGGGGGEGKNAFTTSSPPPTPVSSFRPSHAQVYTTRSYYSGRVGRHTLIPLSTSSSPPSPPVHTYANKQSNLHTHRKSIDLYQQLMKLAGKS